MKKRTVKILTGLAILLVALGVIYAIWVSISAAQLRRAYAALRKDGRPMSMEAVIPPPVEEVNNGALLYESAALLLKATPAPWPEVADPNALSRKEAIQRDKVKNLLGYLSHLSSSFLKEPLEPDKRAELEGLLAEDIVVQALATVKLGTERPSCRFDLDYDAGIDMGLPFLLEMKNLLSILAAKARLEAQPGPSGDVWDLVSTQLRFADALRTEPVVVSQFIRASSITTACETVQQVCAAAPPDRQKCDQLDQVLTGLDDIVPLIAALDGERMLFGEWVFGQPRAQLQRIVQEYTSERYEPDIYRWFRSQRVCFKPLLLADHAAYLRFMHKHARLLELPYAPKRIDTLEDAVLKAKKRHVLARTLTPNMPRVREIYTEMMAQVRVTRAGLALLRHQQQHGSWPGRLDELGLNGLDDPFAAEPLRYRSEAKGFLLYSVGPDQQDDGGHPRAPKQKGDFDIVWHFTGPLPR